MMVHLFKHSIRALKHQKAHVFINVFGLAVGIVCSLIITLFILHELSYDQYHEKKDRIYKLVLHGKLGGQEVRVSSIASPVGPAMKNEFPEVEDFLRVNGWGETIIRYQEKSFTEKEFIEADSSFFNFFSIPLIRGQKDRVLNEPHTLVLSETTAEKIFGEEDPIDKMLKVGTDSVYWRVTGVMEDVPETSHFRASIIGSFMTNPRSDDDEWLSNSFDAYLMLYPNSLPGQVEARIPDLLAKYIGPMLESFLGVTMEEFFSQGNKYNMYLQNLTDVHLDPTVEQMLKPANDPKYLLIFGSIAILIIIIAAVNFMNLSTAQATRRAKEVGIKKVSGSTREALISQFLLESVVLSFLALMLAVVITEISLPYINRLLDVELQIAYFSQWYTIPALLFIGLFIGFLAGAYPAFYLSSFNPYMVLKGGVVKGKGSGRLRNVLVVLQFSISIILIIGTLIMFRQLHFMQNKELGFDKEHVMVLTRAGAIGSHMASFKDELAKVPGVLKVSASTAVPGHNNNNNGYRVKGRPEESFLLQTNWVDYDYMETYGMKLDQGRFFDKSFATDREACVINQLAVKHYQLTDPFDTKFIVFEEVGGEEQYRHVIGVMKDFHFESLKTRIGPYIMRFRNDDMHWGYISMRLSPEAGPKTISGIETLWESFSGNDPIQYFFMDKDLERLYKEERQNSRLAILFTLLGIVVASLGLYGLTSFTVQQRTKEIGVRKTYGASAGNIWYLLAKEILVLVIIAAVIAIPLVYYIADNWLQNYHYRISLRAYDFLAGFIIAVIIALITISYRAFRAARMNPVNALRYE
jgi:putative ABC transport system permease protein